MKDILSALKFARRGNQPLLKKILLVCLWIFPESLCAQKPYWSFGAGGGVQFISKKSTPYDFSPLVLPSANIDYYQPIAEPIGLKTGIVYQMKGIQSLQENTVTGRKTEIKEYTLLHYAGIPLQLTAGWVNTRHYRRQISFGMNYGFLMFARTRQTIRIYENNQLISEQSGSFQNYVAAGRSRDGRRGNDRSELYIFTPSLRFDISVQVHRRLFIGYYYEYNLSDISSNTGTARAVLHSTGIQAGFFLFSHHP